MIVRRLYNDRRVKKWCIFFKIWVIVQKLIKWILLLDLCEIKQPGDYIVNY